MNSLFLEESENTLVKSQETVLISDTLHCVNF